MKIQDIKNFFIKTADFITKIFFTLFPHKNPLESVFQYIIRMFYLSDASGRPSLTSTVLFYVMILVGIVTFIECSIALTPTFIYANGMLVKAYLTGFSVSFLSLIISLSVVITAFYRQRQNKIGSEEPGELPEVEPKGMIEQAKAYIDSVLGRTKPPTPPQGPAGK